MATATSNILDAQRRYGFGRNWRRFLGVLDEERIGVAEESLRQMLEVDDLQGKSFIDVGSGSGLFSLAAARLGASRIHSFDYDRDSVACTQELKSLYKPTMESWTIERGSVLDEDYLAGLGRYDVVYSWGVLHHTGNLWQALGAVVPLVLPQGRLFVAIYNDQGLISRGWRVVKRIYNRNWLGTGLIAAIFVPFFAGRDLASDVRHLRNPFTRYREYKRRRGMSMVYDWLDWLGGYPFEVATPEKIIRFYRDREFTLVKVKRCGRTLGNNEFVFAKPA